MSRMRKLSSSPVARGPRHRLGLCPELEARLVPAPFTLTTAADGGPGSLRAALADPTVDTVQIAPGLAGQTLTLTTGEELLVTHNVTITNLGGGRFPISGNGTSRVIEIRAGVTASLTGLAFTGGLVPSSTMPTPGAGVANAGTLTLTNCAVTGNYYHGTLYINALGAGIGNAGTLTMINCTVADNIASGDGGLGGSACVGGLYTSGTASLTGCTIAGNRASAYGRNWAGGIYEAGGTLALTNCTITGNTSAFVFGDGTDVAGGLNVIGGKATLVNCTLTANTAGTGPGGVHVNTGVPVSLLNTIIAGNAGRPPAFGSPLPDVNGAFASQGFNLIGAADGGSGFTASDKTGTAVAPLDPKLGTLQANGGLTRTMALLAASPAINAGTSAGAPATDQRGFSRATKPQIDIGAIGFQLPSQHAYAAASGPGTDSVVKIYNSDGSLRGVFSPYPGFTGGAQVVVGNVLGDGRDYLVTVPGFGGSPEVHVYDDFGHLVRAFNAYAPGFTGGIQVALAETQPGSGRSDIVTVPGRGGSPEVRVFDGPSGALLRDFNAYDVRFTGGLTVATGDPQGIGIHESIVTAPGRGGAPEVRVFDGRTAALMQDFNAYATAFTGGVTVAVADTAAQGYANIVTAPGAGGSPEVHVYDGQTAALATAFNAYATAFTGGVTLALGDVLGQGYADIVTVPGAGGPAEVHVYDGRTPKVQPDGSAAPDYAFNAYVTAYTAGVTLLVRDMLGSGYAVILTAPVAGNPPNLRVFDAAYRQTLQDFFAFDPTFLGGLALG